jgi:hypothetical protein
MPNGDTGGGGFDFGGIFDPLLGVLAGIIQAIIDFLNALVAALVQALNILFAGEVGIFGFSFAGLDRVFRGFKNLLDQVFKIHVTAALQHLLSLYQKLAKWIAKLKMWLDRLRKIQQLQQAQALRRVINLIQRIRQILVVLRILHVKFAAKLDNWLAGIEGKLITRTAQLAAKTNEIIAWINLIADPTGLFRPGALLGSLTGTIGAFADALGAAGLKNLFPWLAAFTGAGVAVRPWSSVSAQFRQERRGNTGDYGDARRQFLQYKDLFAQDIGGGKP